MQEKDLDTHALVEKLQQEVEELKSTVERQNQELVLLRNDFELVKNEGCWLSKQNTDHLHGGHTHE